MRRAFAATVAMGLLIAATHPALAGIEIAEPSPVAGATTRVVAADEAGPLAGATVTAIFAPNSEVSTTTKLGKTGADGSFEWTPAKAGLVTITVDGAGEKTVPVRYPELPIQALLVFLFATGAYAGFLWLGTSRMGKGPAGSA